jgi:uncharacterized protein YegP (UPF0339 family)
MTIPRRKWFGAAAGVLAASEVATRALAAELGAAGAIFEIYQDRRKEYRWRLKASNGQIIATSGQGYKAKADCRHEIEVVQKEAATAKVEEATSKE